MNNCFYIPRKRNKTRIKGTTSSFSQKVPRAEAGRIRLLSMSDK